MLCVAKEQFKQLNMGVLHTNNNKLEIIIVTKNAKN